MSIENYETDKGTRYRVRYRDPEHRSKAKAGFRTKKAAKEWEAQNYIDMDRGEYNDPNLTRGMTVGKVAEKMLRIHPAKPSTMAKYESAWNARVKARWASVEIGKVRNSAIAEWIVDMQDEGLSAATIGNAIDVLANTLNLAISDKLLRANPMDGIKRPTRTRARRYYLTHEQVALLAKEISTAHEPYGVLVRTLAYTGLRIGELSALRVSDMDFERQRINVLESAAEVKGHRIIGTTKSDRERWTVMPDELVADLRRLCRDKLPDAWVFTSSWGKPISVQRFRSRAFAGAVKRCVTQDATFPAGLTPHSLRRTTASLAVSAGANVKVLQQMLGHGTASLTLDTYSDILPSDMADVARRMSAAARAARADAAASATAEPATV